MATTTKIGIVGAMYVNTGTTAAPTWTEVTKARDVNIKLEGDEVDGTSREAAGWYQMLVGLRKWGTDFEMIYDVTNTAWEAVRSAYWDGVTLEILALDGPLLVNSTYGIFGEVSVSTMTQGQPMKDVMTSAVTFGGVGVPVWGKSASGSFSPVSSS